MLAPVTHILPLTSIRRLRVLPVPGRVVVRTGQKISAADVVAMASIPAGHIVRDIRQGLGIPQISMAERAIVRQQGDKLEKGDVIAETGGLFPRIVRAPADGEIVSISGGQVLLRVKNTEIEVKAGFTGIVGELVPDFGAYIETNGVLVQGVWGNGRIDSGLLIVVAKAPDETLVSSSIDVSMRGAVVLAGHCESADALRIGGDLPLRGLIVASMSADLLPVASELNYPIFVVDGFGKLPMNDLAYKLLSTNEKRDVSINAGFSPMTGERPELVIPLPASGQAAPETEYFAPGQTVRVQGAPYSGKVGKIAQVRQGLYTLPNGLKVQAAEVQIEGEEKRITVPLANLEVIK